MIDPLEYIHPEDTAALKKMESLPGFHALVRKFFSLGFEKMMYGTNLASSIRLGDRQLPDIYRHLPPLCERLGIDTPELYLRVNARPCAWTLGDKRIYITVTSGLAESAGDDELDAVLARECGHIACGHVLYHSVARFVLSDRNAARLVNPLTVPIHYAILYWLRKSELSADRAACLLTGPDTVRRVLTGGPKSILGKVDMRLWAKQADEYDEISKEGIWNKALQISAAALQDHPYSAIRVRELLEWSQSDEYLRLAAKMKRGHPTQGMPSCD